MPPISLLSAAAACTRARHQQRHMMGDDLPVVGARVCPECGHTLNSMSCWFSSHRVAALRQETHQPAGVAGQTHARFFSSCNESRASEFGGADTAKGVPA